MWVQSVPAHTHTPFFFDAEEETDGHTTTEVTVTQTQLNLVCSTVRLFDRPISNLLPSTARIKCCKCAEQTEGNVITS